MTFVQVKSAGLIKIYVYIYIKNVDVKFRLLGYGICFSKNFLSRAKASVCIVVTNATIGNIKNPMYFCLYIKLKR